MNKSTLNDYPCASHNNYNLFFSNLANSLKIKIILTLRKKEMGVSEIVTELKVEQSKISHALKSLKDCNIVTMNQKGKERIYSLNKDTIVPMFALIDKHAFTYCKNKCCQNNTK